MSKYEGKISLAGQQVVKAPTSGKPGAKPSGVKKGEDLRIKK